MFRFLTCGFSYLCLFMYVWMWVVFFAKVCARVWVEVIYIRILQAEFRVE